MAAFLRGVKYVEGAQQSRDGVRVNVVVGAAVTEYDTTHAAVVSPQRHRKGRVAAVARRARLVSQPHAASDQIGRSRQQLHTLSFVVIKKNNNVSPRRCCCRLCASGQREIICSMFRFLRLLFQTETHDFDACPQICRRADPCAMPFAFRLSLIHI